jgi:hypothetical protein
MIKKLSCALVLVVSAATMIFFLVILAAGNGINTGAGQWIVELRDHYQGGDFIILRNTKTGEYQIDLEEME